jgi:integrase
MTKRRHFGTVRKRPGGRWQALYWHEGRRRCEGSFLAKADALAYLATVESDLLRGGWIDPKSGQVTFQTFASDWLSRRSDLSPRTVELYWYLLHNHVFPTLGNIALSGIASSKVRHWNAELSGRHASTASKAYRLVSTIMRTAVSDGLVLSSPCKVSGAGVEHAAERPMATVAEVHALATTMPDYLKIVVLLATWCQLRRGEILGLRRGDVDVMHHTIRIDQSRTFTRDGNSLVKSPKTAAGRRSLSVPESVMKEVVRHMDQFTIRDPDAFLIVDENGKMPSATVLQRAWSKARSAVGRPDLHLHDLRHTGLTLAAATGATTAELMHRAGHASSDAALRYQHATRDRDQVLADALDVLVLSPALGIVKQREARMKTGGAD